MIQATLDSVVCRAQFFFPLNCKKQNRKKNKQKRQRTKTTRVERYTSRTNPLKFLHIC